MIYAYYGFVSLIYVLVFSYAICNFRDSRNERRKGVRHAIEAYSVMIMLMVLVYGLLQFNYLTSADVPVRTLTSNYFYDVINALTHLTAVVAIRTWLGVMKVRINEEKASMFANEDNSSAEEETHY